jgi:hypothetical protein
MGLLLATKTLAVKEKWSHPDSRPIRFFFHNPETGPGQRDHVDLLFCSQFSSS